ncbi:hypothetical protein KQX54_019008 [Cotesia glomerata]|uniref:Uncharacterized protein n=1 Tax=Cotesia glomerata TaxID=32391 RepID=A0AAV7HTH0_COTGL|nr:hypothetical protein KQX54_019008 [Cotesia glomerata]
MVTRSIGRVLICSNGQCLELVVCKPPTLVRSIAREHVDPIITKDTKLVVVVVHQDTEMLISTDTDFKGPMGALFKKIDKDRVVSGYGSSAALEATKGAEEVGGVKTGGFSLEIVNKANTPCSFPQAEAVEALASPVAPFSMTQLIIIQDFSSELQNRVHVSLNINNASVGKRRLLRLLTAV